VSCSRVSGAWAVLLPPLLLRRGSTDDSVDLAATMWRRATGFVAMVPAGRGAATMPPLLLAVMPAWRCVAALPILLLTVVDARGGA